MEVIDTLGNHLALRIEPRSLSNAFPRIENRRRIVARAGAQIRMPRLHAAHGFSECLAHVIGSGYSAEIPSVAGTLARNKETHHRRSSTGLLPSLGSRKKHC